MDRSAWGAIATAKGKANDDDNQGRYRILWDEGPEGIGGLGREDI